MSSVRAVVVSFADPEATVRAVDSLHGQMAPPEEVVVVDNGRNLAGFRLAAEVLVPAENVGYAAGANLGAESTRCDWIFFLNPDAVAAPNALKELLLCANDGVGAVGCQVLLPDGRVNAGDNPVHLSGLSWSGRYGEAVEEGPPREVASLSGAGLLVRADAWKEVGGLDPAYFLYHDDVDLCLRLRLAGWAVVFQPGAHVTHDFEFLSGRGKFYFLERNRLWTVFSLYRAATLILLSPLLLATEAAVLARSLSEGWWREKLRALGSVASSFSYLRRRRADVQASRRVSDRELLVLTTATLETPLAPSSLARRVSPLIELYKSLVTRLVR